MKNPQSSLPPGFRFHPTDEELILHYLRRKVTSAPLPVSIIAEVDIYKFDPWDLPPMAAFGEKEWYFFSPRDRKYPNGARPNRAAASGYWKATGTDKVIVSSSPAHPHENLGVKKALVFYEGRPPKGVKTNWIMHEYRLAESPAYRAINHPVKPKDSSMRLDDWVLCRIYKKSSIMSPVASSTFTAAADHCEVEEEEEVLVQDDPLKTPTNIPSMQSGVNQGGLISQKSSSFSNLIDAWDYSLLSSILSDPTLTLPINSTDPSSQSEHYPNVDIIKNNHGKQMFTNGTINSSSQSFTHHQKLPQLSSSSSPNRTQDTNNIRLKRQRPYDDDAYAVDPASVQPKRFLSQCSFVTNSTSGSGQLDFPQYSNAFNYPFLNQQLLLGPNCSGPFQR